ncbi:hypothetical protein H2201_008652 [Coniosporium apollinis]|uniref:DUF7924 domain-containing protein n=1 Tax=Coniosporium apollinis TaxID=61459 RepID=A0ABQ9NGF0_9PEZI|nr:hypothetical protein H2201_008652 [Coniosporium apollinis]
MSSSESAQRSRVESSSTRNTFSRTSTIRKTSAYDAGFEQHLVENGIYPHGHEHLDDRDSPGPDNWEEINQALAQPRPSLSPSRFSDGAFRAFERANSRAYNEAKIMSSVLPIIAGSGDIPSQENIKYTNLAPLTDGTITAPKPDFYDGVRPEQLDRRVRNELGRYIVPSKNLSTPALPNFFVEAKGPDGSAAVAKRQACYDGAIGARAMLYTRSYASGDDMEYDGNAYTITSTYHDGTLKMYTTHPTQPAEPDGNPNYHMTQLRTFAMTNTLETFRQAAGAFRNARDWAKEQRDDAIAAANRKANGHGNAPSIESPGLDLVTSFASEAPSQASTTSVDEVPYTIESLSQETSLTSDTTVHESETSTDELVLDLKTPAKRSSRHSQRLQRSQRKRRNAGTTLRNPYAHHGVHFLNKTTARTARALLK